MAANPQVVFRQRPCKARECRVLFFICSHCDRGQRYCSLACRHSSLLLQRRAARRRHQQSPEGRLDHRDRQRIYRRRKAASTRLPIAKSVTDNGSQPEPSHVSIAPPCKWPPEPEGSAGQADAKTTEPIRSQSAVDRLSWRQQLSRFISDLGFVVCRFCGRLGRYLNPFHEPG